MDDENRPYTGPYPNINIPLLRKTVEWVEEQEAKSFIPVTEWSDEMDEVVWNQANWFEGKISGESMEVVADNGLLSKGLILCDTTHCFAGKIVQDTGEWVPVMVVDPDQEYSGVGEFGTGTIAHKETGRLSTVNKVANELLGWTDPDEETANEQAGPMVEFPYHGEMFLYSGSNTASDIRMIAEALAGEAL